MGRWMPAESSGVWPGLSKRLSAALNLPRENPPVVEEPLPCWQGLSQAGFVLPLCRAESGQGRVPGDPSETWEPPAQPSSHQAWMFRAMKDTKSYSRIPPVAGDVPCGPPSRAVSLGLRKMNFLGGGGVVTNDGF